MLCSIGGIQPKLIAQNCQVICICGVDLCVHNYTYLFNKFKLFGMSAIHILLICEPFIYYFDVNKSFLLRRQDYHDFAPWWLKHQNGDGEMNIFIFHKHFFLLISETLWYFFFHKNVYTSYFLYMLIFLFFQKHFDISYFASEVKMCFPSNIDCWRQRRAFQFLIFPKCPELL